MFLQASVCLQGGVPDQVHPPGTRCTPWDQVHPLGPGAHPPGLGVVPGTPPGPGTPPRPGTPPEIRPLMRTVRILLECILVSYLLVVANQIYLHS